MFLRYFLLVLFFLLILRMIKNAIRSFFRPPENMRTPENAKPFPNIDESNIQDANFKDL